MKEKQPVDIEPRLLGPQPWRHSREQVRAAFAAWMRYQPDGIRKRAVEMMLNRADVGPSCEP